MALLLEMRTNVSRGKYHDVYPYFQIYQKKMNTVKSYNLSFENMNVY